MDEIIKALAYGDEISVSIINGTNMVNKAIKLHNLSPVAAAALGRTLLAGALLSADFKNNNQELTVQINGKGPIGSVVVNAEFGIKVRGYVDNPNVDIPLNAAGKLDVGGAVGQDGELVMLSKGENGSIYTSRSQLVSGEIGDDFAYYFASSQQTNTAVALGVLIGKDGSCTSAGGILISILPNCSEEVISKVENTLPKLSNISRLVAEFNKEEILSNYFKTDKITARSMPQYICKCNDNMIASVVINLGKAEIDEATANGNLIEVVCPFCSKKYHFNKNQAYKLLNIN